MTGLNSSVEARTGPGFAISFSYLKSEYSRDFPLLEQIALRLRAPIVLAQIGILRAHSVTHVVAEEIEGFSGMQYVW